MPRPEDVLECRAQDTRGTAVRGASRRTLIGVHVRTRCRAPDVFGRGPGRAQGLSRHYFELGSRSSMRQENAERSITNLRKLIR